MPPWATGDEHAMYEADAAHKVEGICRLVEDCGLRPRTVLDLGCGTGAVLAGVCARLGASGIGVDVDPDAIGRIAGYPGVRFELGDARDTPHTADLVLCVDVFEHVPDDVGFLRAVRDRGRWFAFRVPLDDAAWDRLRGRTARFREEYGHLHAYTWGRAVRTIEAAGYEVRCVRPHRIPAGGLLSRGIRRVAGAVAPRLATRVIGGWSLLVLARGGRAS